MICDIKFNYIALANKKCKFFHLELIFYLYHQYIVDIYQDFRYFFDTRYICDISRYFRREGMGERREERGVRKEREKKIRKEIIL